MFVKERFKLVESTLDELKSMTPEFGYNGFGEFIFWRTYSRTKQNNDQENWNDVINRVTEGTFSIRKDWYIKNHIPWNESFWQVYARHFAVSMFKMEWLPPGRGLWSMGSEFVYNRGSAALQNCFSGNTRFVTTIGLFRLKDCVEKSFNILTDSGKIAKGTVKHYGQQNLRNFIFKPKRSGKSNFKFTIQATQNHRWLLENGHETTYLQEKDVIKACAQLPIDFDSEEYDEGFCHGLIFADGHNHPIYKDRFDIRLCGEKIKYLDYFERHLNFLSASYPPSYGGDCLLTLTKVTENLKEFPNHTGTYKRGFLDGWMAGDSCTKSNGAIRLDSTNESAYNWLVENNGILGYYVIGHSIDNNPTNFGNRNLPLNRFILTKEPVCYAVETIYGSSFEDVYCLEVPGRNTFTLASGLPTGNCGFTILGESFEDDIHWMMDLLMCGVGIGFLPERQNDLKIYCPHGTHDYIIPDSREGWCDSVKTLIQSYREKGSTKPKFKYDLIRAEGEPIRGFGGVCSGPAPLIKFHQRIEELLEMYACEEWYDSVLLKTDLANCVGCCVVAGNVRRSAELCAGTIDEVMDLKQYDKYPHRKEWGWMSNNSVFLETTEDFERLGEIAKRVILNGEPGYINKVNLPFGRIGKPMDDLRLDKAIAFNPLNLAA